jgi:TonB family protein
MTTPAPKYPRLVAAGLGSLAALVAFALVATPAPPLFAQTTAKAVPPIAKAVPQDSAREKIVVAVPAKLPVVWTEAKPTNAAPAKKTPVAVRTPQTTARADSATQQTQKVVGTLNPVTIHAALRAAAAAPQQATVRNQDSIRAQLQRDREELARLRERIAANEALLLRARPDSTPMVPDSLERALGAYLASQVDTEVRAVPGQRAPYYPPALRGANVEGSVVLRFVVDTNGRALMETVRVISSSHLLFTSAVTTHLPYLRFIPGNLRGAPVRQIVRMPFVFTLSR